MTFSKFYYLTEIKGSNKGVLGELLFKNSCKHIFCTKLCRPDILDRLPFKIPSKEFLTDNWFTLDCFKFIINKNQESYEYLKTILYEIKTVNHCTLNRPGIYRRMKFTDNQIKTYREAQKIGLDVNVVKITLYKDGKYTIDITHLDDEMYKCVVCNGTESFQKRPQSRVQFSRF